MPTRGLRTTALKGRGKAPPNPKGKNLKEEQKRHLSFQGYRESKRCRTGRKGERGEIYVLEPRRREREEEEVRKRGQTERGIVSNDTPVVTCTSLW